MTDKITWPPHGWLIVVSLPCVTRGPDDHVLFAAALQSRDDAVAAVRLAIGPLGATLEARCRISARAMMRLRLKPGCVLRLPDRDDRYRGTSVATPRGDGRYWAPRRRAN